MPIKWTPQQADIINAIGRVYVTASAGTGKTAVLTEKAIKLIRDGVSVDKILLITFTVAAAGEMKQRIFEALKKEYLACDSQSLPFIRRQLQLIDNAKICTIHSFCSSVISEFFFKVGLTPAFRIAEQF